MYFKNIITQSPICVTYVDMADLGAGESVYWFIIHQWFTQGIHIFYTVDICKNILRRRLGYRDKNNIEIYILFSSLNTYLIKLSETNLFYREFSLSCFSHRIG